MGSAHMVSMVLLQGGDAAGSDHMQLLVIFVGVIAFCSFVQFLVLMGAAIAGLKAWKGVMAEVETVKQKAFPIIATVQTILNDATPKVKAVTATVQDLVTDVSPKVKTVTSNIVEISDVARSKVREFESTLDSANETIRDANSKTQAQVNKVDDMVSSVLKTTSDLSTTIQRGIRMPVMEVAGVVNGLKAAMEVLVGRSKGPATDRPRSGGFGRPYGTPGPTPVPSAEPYAEPFGSASSNPSSNVAPSPGAAAVAERLRSEKIKTIY